MAETQRSRPRLVLAGDIGGTKTVLAAFEPRDDRLRIVFQQRYASRNHATFDALLADFLAAAPARPEAACFGVAGPIENGICHTTNLPWRLDAGAISDLLGGVRVELVNDLAATALGVLHLEPTDFAELQSGSGPLVGNAAVIAAGTGLGEAILARVGDRHHPVASEGGHADFAPSNELQIDLLRHLRGRYGHVSRERLLSGPGLREIHGFLCERNRTPPPAQLAALPADERGARITALGLDGTDPVCRETIEVFTDIYGAEAGNLALGCTAFGGLYVAGGIAPRLVPPMAERFLNAFNAKGRFTEMMRRIPVKVVLQALAPLIGAAHRAFDPPRT